MKRTACSVVIAIIAFYTVYAFSPHAAQQAVSTQTVAQEPAKKVVPDPFASDAAAPKKGKPPQENDSGKSVRDTASDFVEERISKPGNFEFPDVSLQDVVDVLATKHEIPFLIDKKALEDAGIGTDKTVNINLRGMPMDKFLDLMCSELELTWIVKDGYVLITTPDRLPSLMEVRVYNCSDLIVMVKFPPPGAQGATGGGFGGGGSAPARGGLGGEAGAGQAPGNPEGAPTGGRGGGFFAVPPGTDSPPQPVGTISSLTPVGSPDGTKKDKSELMPDNESLINLIEQTLEPDSWTSMGGSGSIEVYHGGLLVISQDWRTHRRIEKLLSMLRKAKQGEPGVVVRER